MKSQPPTRRQARSERRQIEQEFRRLARDGNEQGFRTYLSARGIAEGSDQWRLAWEAWREMLVGPD